MNTLHRMASMAAATAALMLASCASTIQSRIAHNPEKFRSLSAEQQQLVSRGQIARGMPKPGVFIAWGRPDDVAIVEKSGSKTERWGYFGLAPVFTQRVGIGYGYGWGHHPWAYGGADPFYYGGPEVDYMAVPIAHVDFRNGVVSEWEAKVR